MTPSSAHRVAKPSTLPPTNEIIEALKARCPWPTLREALKNEQLSAGNGWADLIGRANEKTDTAKKLGSFLQVFYENYITAGERYVQMWGLDQSVLDVLIPKLNAAIIPSSDFSSSYPLELTPFRGHLILMEKGVHHVQKENRLSGGISAADC